MPTYKELYGAKAGSVMVEVQDTGPGTSGIEAKNLIRAVQAMAQIGADSIEDLPKEKRPAEAEFSFGMRALSSGEFAICLQEAQASVRVRLKWTTSPDTSEMASSLLSTFK